MNEYCCYSRKHDPEVVIEWNGASFHMGPPKDRMGNTMWNARYTKVRWCPFCGRKLDPATDARGEAWFLAMHPVNPDESLFYSDLPGWWFDNWVMLAGWASKYLSPTDATWGVQGRRRGVRE